MKGFNLDLRSLLLDMYSVIRHPLNMEQVIKCVLVDDEPAARRKMIRMLSEYDYIQVVGEAGNVSSALSLIREEVPDLIFLDIQLNGETGFDLLNRLHSPIHVIFVTAYDDYALLAFEADTLDYLVKPIHPKRLKQCLEKVGRFNAMGSDEANDRENDFFLEDISGGVHRVSPRRIGAIKAQGDYSMVYTAKGEFLVRRSIKKWMELLPDSFFKVSRSSVVNLYALSELLPENTGQFSVSMKEFQCVVQLTRTEGLRLRKVL